MCILLIAFTRIRFCVHMKEYQWKTNTEHGNCRLWHRGLYKHLLKQPHHWGIKISRSNGVVNMTWLWLHCFLLLFDDAVLLLLLFTDSIWLLLSLMQGMVKLSLKVTILLGDNNIGKKVVVNMTRKLFYSCILCLLLLFRSE